MCIRDSVEIILDDGDMNVNARSQEQMTVGANSTIVPAVKIGSPITLKTLEKVTYVDDDTSQTEITFDQGLDDAACSSDYNTSTTQSTRDTSYLSCYEKYSERSIMTKESTGDWTIATNDRLIFTYGGTTVGDLETLINGANGTAAVSYTHLTLPTKA